jgi:Protein of unknown function (DUF2939)
VIPGEEFMRRVLMFVLVAVIALAAFYMAWPLWSGYSIYQALEARDAATLAAKIDFPSLRQSVKPRVTAEVDKAFDKIGGQAGGLLQGGLKAQLAPQLVDSVLESMVTPDNLSVLYARRADLRSVFGKKLAPVQGQSAEGDVSVGGIKLPGNLGGLLGKITGRTGGEASTEADPAAEANSTEPATRSRLGNLRYITMNGPLGIDIAVARDQSTNAPDVVAHLAFSGLDWKLVGVTLK